jgi:8-oxo-dGTP diphosphatase
LFEEVGINVISATELTRIRHDYADRRVTLDVWLVTEFDGEAHGREGQKIKWCTLAALAEHDFPAANAPIITALQQCEQLSVSRKEKPDLPVE